ncbi:MAG: hypothetical protein AAF928_05875 [Myxococcota bacterium]
MNRILWLHDEALGPDTPALHAFPDAPAVFVFDDAWQRDEQLSLKRIVFMYECLLDLPVEIRRGDVVEEVRAFAQRFGAEEIVAPESPHPRIRRQGRDLDVRWHEAPPFVRLDRKPDLKRFSRYWRVAKKSVFRPTADQ